MPEKAEYARLEDDPEYLFTFQLASHLHKSRAELLELPNVELVAWNAYLLREEQLAELRTKVAKQRR